MSSLLNVHHPTGKTYHMWQIDRDPLPMGAPQLMMAITDRSQADPRLVKQLETKYGVDTSLGGAPAPVLLFALIVFFFKKK